MTVAADAPSTRPRALLLDVDGTLLDTVWFHVTAWWEAFEAAGHAVSCLDVHHAVGRGSHDLVRTLVGEDVDVEAVVQGHAERWAPLRERCRPFSRADELIRAVAGRGVQVVLCTSASAEDTTTFRAKLGCDDVVAAVVSSADVESAKPAPDLVLAALGAVGAQPQDAVMVGDTVFDVRAAAAAGVPAVGLLCGGIPAADLREAGAASVHHDPSALLQELEGSPIAALLS